MSTFQKVIAYMIRFIAKPLKWLAGLLFFLLLFLFVIFLFTGNSWASFINGVTLSLAGGALGAIIGHVMLTDFADALLNNERTLPEFQHMQAPPVQKKRRKKRKQSNKKGASGKVVQMSDWR